MFSIRYLLIFASLLIYSCSQTKPHHYQLIRWTKEFVMNDGKEANGFYLDHKTFTKRYYKAEYAKDTLKVSALMEVNACGNPFGDIRIKEDSLFLFTRDEAKEVCTSTKFYQFTYWIWNPKKIKYKIASLQHQ
jgi:hypothetical protein